MFIGHANRLFMNSLDAFFMHALKFPTVPNQTKLTQMQTQLESIKMILKEQSASDIFNYPIVNICPVLFTINYLCMK